MKSSRRVGRLGALGAIALVVVAWWGQRAAQGDWQGALDRLGDASPQVREAAIQTLVAQGEPVVASLVTSLGAETSLLVQTGLAETLRRIGLDEAQVTTLRSLLYSPSPSTRRIVLGLVAATTPSALISDLEGVVRNRQELVENRGVAALALGSTGGKPRTLLREAVLDVTDAGAARASLVLGLALTGAQGVEDAAELATGTKVPGELRIAAWQALADVRVGATKRLLELLESDAVETRRRATAALHVRGDPQDADVAAALTQRIAEDADAGVRGAALAAVSDSPYLAQATSEVVGRLADTDARVRGLAARIVGRGGLEVTSETLAVLEGLLADGVFHVRHEAALSLAALGHGKGYVVMLEDTKSADPVVQATAGAAVTSITTLLQAAAK